MPAPHIFAAPAIAGSAGTPGIGSLTGLTLALLLVLALVFGLAWLMRRFRGFVRGDRAGIEIVADASLGSKERAVLLQVGTTQVLVGVAPGQVRALHVFETPVIERAQKAPAVPGSPGAERPNGFRDILMRSLGR